MATSTRKLVVALIVMMALTTCARAQDASSAASGASGAAGAAPAVPAQASGIVGLVQMAAGAIKACKAKICACPLGQLIQNAAKPMNTMLGGLLCPPCCPPVNPEDLKKPSTSPLGACAKITAEELEMPKRRKAIQCLARADCHWWPEAEAGILTGLRVDQNECVRLEAALALLNGCCCTKKTIEALTIVVTGSRKDGNPSENSERVKAAALGALQRCLACYKEDEEPPPLEKPPAKPPAKPPSKPVADLEVRPEFLLYYDAVAAKPSVEVLDNARRVLASKSATVPAPPASASAALGGRSFAQLWDNADKPRALPRNPTEAVAGTPANLPALPVAQSQIKPAVYQPAESPPRVRLMFQD